jgi:hypothetical protein
MSAYYYGAACLSLRVRKGHPIHARVFCSLLKALSDGSSFDRITNRPAHQSLRLDMHSASCLKQTLPCATYS